MPGTVCVCMSVCVFNTVQINNMCVCIYILKGTRIMLNILLCNLILILRTFEAFFL